MVPPLEHAAAAAFLNNVMGKLFQALGLLETYKMLRDLEQGSESLRLDLSMLAAAVDDELTASSGARRTAVARAYSSEMRALTHDVEDCVERFVHRVTGGGRLDGASRLRRAAHAVGTLRTCYRFAGEIKKLKKRVQEASSRVLKPSDGGGGQPSGSRLAAARRAADHAARRPVGIERPMEELLALLGLGVGQVEAQAQQPPPALEQQPRVIAIVGFGGVGKTTLARAVYDDGRVADAFPCRAWVAVRSPEDGDAAGILENIHQQLLPGQPYSESSLTRHLKDKRSKADLFFRLPILHHSISALPSQKIPTVTEIFSPVLSSPLAFNASPAGLHSIIAMCTKLKELFDLYQMRSPLFAPLPKSRYLVVIDDIDEIEEEQWDTITSAFHGNGEGSRIIVTTIFRPTANRRSDPNGCVYKMRTLGMRDSIAVALRGRCAAELVQGSETLLKKCDGLPLALVSVARQLCSEDEPTGKFCSELCGKLGSYLEREDGEPNFARLRDVLMDNYTSLSDLTLRTCLLYLGMFPIDRPLRKNVIIRRWLAEGYARSEDITLSEQSVANENFKTFVDRNIIHPVKISKNAEVKTCKTHGIMHEFLLHRSMCEKFILCSYAPKDKIVRHLFINGDVDDETNSTKTLNVDLSRIRSLTVRGNAGSAISDFGKYKLIRVLDLEDCTDVKDTHLKKISKLWNLRYLSLSDNITRLPKEIAKLNLLETLVLNKTVVTMLPVEVIGMPYLTNLIGKFNLLEDCESVSELERLSKSKELEEMCRKSKLETLAGVLANSRQRQGFLEHMVSIKNLRKVKLWCESTGDARDLNDLNEDLAKAIRQYTRSPMGAGYVRCMSLDFQGLPQGSIHALQDLYHHSMSSHDTYYLSSLKLHGDLSTSHEFVAMLSGLTELCLKSATMAWDLLSTLSGMPFLLYLTLITDKIEDFIIKVGAFQCLRRLRFVLQHENAALPEIEEGALPELVSLQVPCKHLAGPSGIEIKHLRKLQEIELHPKVSDSARQEWEAAAWNHPNRPNVLPFISVDDRVAEKPTINSVGSPNESGHEEVLQLADKEPGPSVQHMPLSICNSSEIRSEMGYPAKQEAMKYTIVPDEAADETRIDERQLFEEPLEHTPVHKRQDDISPQPRPTDICSRTASQGGSPSEHGHERDDPRDRQAPGEPGALEDSTYVPGRPAKVASMYSVVLTDQQGIYTCSELGPTCSCHASHSIGLLNTSNGSLHVRANGDVNDGLR